MRIKFEKNDSIEDVARATSDFLSEKSKDYPKFKSPASVYVNFEDEFGNPHPQNNENYIYKDGEIVSETKYLSELAMKRIKESWNNYVNNMSKRKWLYPIVQELKVQEPFVFVQTERYNNDTPTVHVCLKFTDNKNNIWLFYNNSLSDICPAFAQKYK